MDIQKMMDAVIEASAQARKPYHLLLGQLKEIAEAHPDFVFRLDTGEGIGSPHSYRGYYNELSLTPGGDPVLGTEVFEICRAAEVGSFEGYKGGTYEYDAETPLWVAPYGCTGRAITGHRIEDNTVVLTTRDSD